MTHAIFIKTCARDLDWLKLSLRSIAKFCSGFDEVVIISPDTDRALFNQLGLTQEKLVYDHEPTTDGYTWQQVVKLHADFYTTAQRILYVDSDCIFHTPVTPDYFLKDGKPYMLYTPFAVLGNTVPWQHGSEFVMGEPVPYEFMRRHPAMHHRETLVGFREFIATRFQKPCREFMLEEMPKHRISEFNALGAFAWLHRHNEYEWFNTEAGPFPKDCLHQFWSYSRVDHPSNAAKIKELEALL